PVPLWEAIQSVIEKANLSTIEDLTEALDSVLSGLESDEVDRRIKAELGTHFFRPESPIDQIPNQAAESAKILLNRYSGTVVLDLQETMRKRVQELTKRMQRREHFHGKQALE